jgi:signal transduction histidine kinase
MTAVPAPEPHPRPGVPPPDRLADTRRLDDIDATGLLRESANEAFQTATRIASRALRSPVALVSVVTADRQVFVGEHGLADPPDRVGGTPLTHSFCQHVVSNDEPLVVVDARGDDRVSGNLAIDELGVVSYLGVPLHSPSGRTLGSFCVIDRAPREWTDDDLALLRELAAGIERGLHVRVALDEARVQRQWLDNVMATLLHDVRVPVETILEGVETLMLDPDEVDEETREATVVATSLESRRLVGMLEGLAQRHRGAAPTLAEAAVVVRDLVEARRLGRHRGRLSLDLAIDVDERVAVAVEPFQSLVANLLDNALGHTAGPVRVALHVGREGVDLEVADDGPGFTVDRTELSPVGRGGELPDPEDGSLRLGLRIVRRRVEELGGAIRVDSAPDRGTVVSVWVPAAEAP